MFIDYKVMIDYKLMIDYKIMTDYKTLIDYKCTQMQLFIELIIWRLADLRHMW